MENNNEKQTATNSSIWRNVAWVAMGFIAGVVVAFGILTTTVSQKTKEVTNQIEATQEENKATNEEANTDTDTQEVEEAE